MATGDVTQYIGARYVPVFADPLDWVNTREYEPLTIVYYGGNSYTSKQYVPTGIDITNGDYWVVTGNYNAQIEQYRNEVEQMQTQVTTNTNDITQVKSDMTTLENNVDSEISNLQTTVNGQISELQTTVDGQISELQTTVDGQISELQTTVESELQETETTVNNTLSSCIKYEGYTTRKCVCIGDSFLRGSGEGNTIGNGWGHFLEQLTGWDCSIYEGGGAAFLRAAQSGSMTGKTIPEIAEYAVGDIDENTRKITDYVVVIGGYNDYQYTTDTSTAKTNLTNAVNTTIATLKAGFPSAKLYFATNYAGSSAKTAANAAARVDIAAIPYFDTIYNAVFDNKALWLNGITSCFFNKDDLVTSDNYHPNENGYEYLAQCIYKAINGEDIAYTVNRKALSFSNTYFNSTGFYSVNNGILQLYFRSVLLRDLDMSTYSITEVPANLPELISLDPYPELIGLLDKSCLRDDYFTAIPVFFGRGTAANATTNLTSTCAFLYLTDDDGHRALNLSRCKNIQNDGSVTPILTTNTRIYCEFTVNLNSWFN